MISLSHQSAMLSIPCLRYFYPRRRAGPVTRCSAALAARISKHHMQCFARSRWPDPQSQGQGWGQDLKSPCRSHSLPEERFCTSTSCYHPHLPNKKLKVPKGEACRCLEHRHRASLGLGLLRRKRIEQFEPWGSRLWSKNSKGWGWAGSRFREYIQLLLQHWFPRCLEQPTASGKKRLSHFNSFAPFILVRVLSSHHSGCRRPAADQAFKASIEICWAATGPTDSIENCSFSAHLEIGPFLLKMGNQKGRHPAFEATFGNIYI